MQQYELNLRDYLRIFRKRRLVILATFVVVTLFSALYLSRHIDIYRSSVTIKIEERKTIAGLLTEWIVYNPGDVMESEAKFITSYPVMKEVARRMRLVPDGASVEDINNAVGSVQAKVATERIGNSNMIRITVTSLKPQEAVDLANTIGQVYIEENLAEKAKQARHAREFIEEQLATLDARLKAAEEQLKEFGQGPDKVVLAEPIREKLLELEFKLAELQQKFTDKHPQVIQLRDQIRGMEAQVSGASGKQLEYSRLTREVEVNKKLYAMLKEKLEEARITEAQKVSDVSIVDPAVLPRAPIGGDNSMKVVVGALLGLFLGVALAFVLETMDTSIGTIEDVENVVKLPVLGVIPSFESELEPNLDLFARLKERILPSGKKKEETQVRLMAHFKPHSTFTEAFRNVYTNLKLGPEKKVILVTSSSPKEGKSSVVCNLGIVMAQVGLRTVLISADLRRPVLAKSFGVKREPGLQELVLGTSTMDTALRNITDYILGDLKFEDVRTTPGLENLWLLPTGKLPSNPVEVLESKKMEAVMQQLRREFDVVIFDAPPVLPVTDASILASKVDTVAIVYECGRTSREALTRTKIQLEAVGAKIAGVILNHTRPQAESLSPYPYYGKYRYRYYSKEEDSAKPRAAADGPADDRAQA